MSAATTTTPSPATAGVGSTASLLRKLAGGTSLAAVLAATAIAVWPASEAEKAYDDGERFGAAVAQLQTAGTTEEVDDALAEMHAAATETREHGNDAVAQQVADQEDALDRAADGFAGSRSAGDSFEADLYQAELDTAVDDLSGNAEDFRATGPGVQQSFWDGYQDGLAA